MHRGPLIIPNPNRPHCCPVPQGLGLHWGTRHPICEWAHIFSIFPNPAVYVPSQAPTLCSHKQQSLDRNHLRRQSETVLWPSAMDEYRITCSKVSVPPRGNTIDWFPLTHTTHHHPQQCRLCRYNRRTQPARPREPSYMHQVTDSPPPAENKLQSSAARQRRSPESHTRRELARVSATS